MLMDRGVRCDGWTWGGKVDQEKCDSIECERSAIPGSPWNMIKTYQMGWDPSQSMSSVGSAASIFTKVTS